MPRTNNKWVGLRGLAQYRAVKRDVLNSLLNLPTGASIEGSKLAAEFDLGSYYFYKLIQRFKKNIKTRSRREMAIRDLLSDGIIDFVEQKGKCYFSRGQGEKPIQPKLIEETIKINPIYANDLRIPKEIEQKYQMPENALIEDNFQKTITEYYRKAWTKGGIENLEGLLLLMSNKFLFDQESRDVANVKGMIETKLKALKSGLI